MISLNTNINTGAYSLNKQPVAFKGATANIAAPIASSVKKEKSLVAELAVATITDAYRGAKAFLSTTVDKLTGKYDREAVMAAKERASVLESVPAYSDYFSYGGPAK